jgi:hypothetical protein
VPRRNLVPLLLLAVLGVLALLFAVLGASAAPSGATLTVQNASNQTFGSPTGSTSFTLELVNTVSAGAGPASLTNVRQIRYVPPDHMAVYLVGTTTKLAAVLGPAAITCTLSVYTSLVGGSTPWTPVAGAFTRTETLTEYSSRVSNVGDTTCQPRPSAVQGTVAERASVRQGYLVGVRVTIHVPEQTLSNGSQATSGSEGEAVLLLKINGTPTRSLAKS